ncbi:MAG: hypothetical protein K2N85_06120, partial [Lachnospiraceae bacterium]|nr:hypothetical protein [Lachnospiraceae bacterium]
MEDPQNINLNKILTYWGFTDAKITKYFHPDSPRIVAEISVGNKQYILKGIPYTRDGESREEQTIYGNVLAHQFLGNQRGIAPQIFPTKCSPQDYYLKKDGYWFFLIEFIEGRPMQETPADELLLGKLARKLHSLEGYSFPTALNENKQRFYSWFSEKPFK